MGESRRKRGRGEEKVGQDNIREGVGGRGGGRLIFF